MPAPSGPSPPPEASYVAASSPRTWQKQLRRRMPQPRSWAQSTLVPAGTLLLYLGKQTAERGARPGYCEGSVRSRGPGMLISECGCCNRQLFPSPSQEGKGGQGRAGQPARRAGGSAAKQMQGGAGAPGTRRAGGCPPCWVVLEPGEGPRPAGGSAPSPARPHSVLSQQQPQASCVGLGF